MTPAEATARLERAADVLETEVVDVLYAGADRMADAAIAAADAVLERRTGALIASIHAERMSSDAQLVAGGPEAPYLVYHEARLGFVRRAVEREIPNVSRALSDLVSTSLGGGRRGE